MLSEANHHNTDVGYLAQYPDTAKSQVRVSVLLTTLLFLGYATSARHSAASYTVCMNAPPGETLISVAITMVFLATIPTPVLTKSEKHRTTPEFSVCA